MKRSANDGSFELLISKIDSTFKMGKLVWGGTPKQVLATLNKNEIF